MEKLLEFLALLTGEFDNREQFDAMQAAGKEYPFAEHRNTLVNERITGLPEGFSGAFLLEESTYTTGGARRPSCHLFLFTEKAEGIRLTSYELPEGAGQSVTAADFPVTAYEALVPSRKFTPALYRERDGVWEGGSDSEFAPGLTFHLWERFGPDRLEVSEQMERGGRRIFGYDEPICYKRI